MSICVTYKYFILETISFYIHVTLTLRRFQRIQHISLQENTPNTDRASDGIQCRRKFLTDFRPISDENKKIEVVGIPSANSDEFPKKHGSSEFSDFRQLFDDIPIKIYNRCSRRKFVGIYRRNSDDIPINRYNRYGRRYSVGIFR